MNCGVVYKWTADFVIMGFVGQILIPSVVIFSFLHVWTVNKFIFRVAWIPHNHHKQWNSKACPGWYPLLWEWTVYYENGLFTMRMDCLQWGTLVDENKKHLCLYYHNLANYAHEVSIHSYIFSPDSSSCPRVFTSTFSPLALQWNITHCMYIVLKFFILWSHVVTICTNSVEAYLRARPSDTHM